MSAVMRISNRQGGFEAGLEAAFDDLIRRTFGDAPAAAWTPAADVVRDGEDIIITLELPGISAENVEVEARDHMLMVRGTRENTLTSNENGVFRREIRTGSFSRGFRLPAHIGPDAIHAFYDAGMLTIRVTGAQPAPVTRVVPIENLPSGKAIEGATEQAENDTAVEEKDNEA